MMVSKAEKSNLWFLPYILRDPNTKDNKFVNDTCIRVSVVLFTKKKKKKTLTGGTRTAVDIIDYFIII